METMAFNRRIEFKGHCCPSGMDKKAFVRSRLAEQEN